jgi:hypothetical protein
VPEQSIEHVATDRTPTFVVESVEVVTEPARRAREKRLHGFD